jgi:hypothetical protein
VEGEEGFELKGEEYGKRGAVGGKTMKKSSVTDDF